MTPASGTNRRRTLLRRPDALGAVVSVALVAALTAGMVPIRTHMSVATSALVLVVPVVVGVAAGGLTAGLVAVIAGFLAYDFFFIPPYGTLSVGAAQNWVALGVYAVVTAVVAQVVARLNAARAQAQARTLEVERLLELADLLAREAELPVLLETIVGAVVDAFDLEGVALMLPVGDRLELVASAGEPIPEHLLQRLTAAEGLPVAIAGTGGGRDALQAVALSTSGAPVGLLALRGFQPGPRESDLLAAFTNHLAAALERARLQERLLRAHLIEQIDNARTTLVGAVSHDLRTPLATIKVSTTTLLDPELAVPEGDVTELLTLIDAQVDRLERLVTNLLDMTRIQSGSLVPSTESVPVADLVEHAVALLGPHGGGGRVTFDAPADLPPADVDPVLAGQIVANLIDNAVRYSPPDAPVEVTAARRGNEIQITVADRGPGIDGDDREAVFHLASRRGSGGRGGLGLAIAHAFTDAHRGRIWVEPRPGGGSRFVVALPAAGAH